MGPPTPKHVLMPRHMSGRCPIGFHCTAMSAAALLLGVGQEAALAGWGMTGFYGMKLMKPPEMVISPTTMEKSWEYITWEWKWDNFGITSSFIRKSHLYVSYGWILLVARWLPIWLSSQFILNLVSGWRVQPLFMFNMFWWLFSMLLFSSISSR